MQKRMYILHIKGKKKIWKCVPCKLNKWLKSPTVQKNLWVKDQNKLKSSFSQYLFDVRCQTLSDLCHDYTWEDENGTVPSLSSLSWLQRGVDKLPVCPCARGLTAHRLVPVIHLSAWKSRMSRVANSSRQVDAASQRTWYSRMSDIINRWITGNGWHEDLTGSFYSPLSVRTFYTF